MKTFVDMINFLFLIVSGSLDFNWPELHNSYCLLNCNQGEKTYYRCLSSLLKNKHFSDSYSFLYVHLTHSDLGYKLVIVRTYQSLSVTLIPVTHLTCGNLARDWIGSATVSMFLIPILFYFCPFLLLLTLVSQSWQTLFVDPNRIRILSVISLFSLLHCYYFPL